MNKKITKLAVLPLIILTAPLMQSCIEENLPTSYATASQLNNSESAQRLLNGLNAMMVDQFSYNKSYQTAYDWGYPCQMVIRDILGGDMPVAGVNGNGSSGDFLSYIADNSYLSVFPLYTYTYYYQLIANANTIIGNYGGEDSNYKEYAGAALAYRALAYMDLARMFEYKKTGFAIDNEASNVWGLTVPIVTESTTKNEAKHNPRVPFYTMYRFLLNDLNTAEEDLKGFTRENKSTPDLSVVYGLKARLWLEMGTRFDKAPDDLSTQLQHEDDTDGYANIGVTTAEKCYAKASEYAKKAIASNGYSPVTKEEWFNSKNGFCNANANQSWMWAASMGSKEMISYEWYIWTCWMCPESTAFSWGPYFDSFHAIDKALYDNIGEKDWRKKTWVAPEDANKDKVPNGYATVLSDNNWKILPAYAGLKFHLKDGDAENYQVGLLTDIPLMRMEEMYFIDAEATAHTSGVAFGKNKLESFMNAYRYTDGSYSCKASNMSDFIDELMVQKRIEFWGEGLTFFDNKRLAKQIKRYYDGSNYPTTYQLNSKKDCVAPWMNYYIYTYIRDYNQAVELNPDPSNTVKYQTNY